MTTATSDLPPTPRKPDTSRAIEAKKAEKAANRQRIAEAITRLTSAGEAVNVKAVARAAGVHPDTIRRNEDLLAEVVRHRDGKVSRRVQGSDRESAATTALRARLSAAQSEIKDLRSQLTAATNATHQALGTAGSSMDHATAERLKQESAEVAVALVEAQSRIRDLTRQRDELNDELVASHDVNRDYARQLTRATEDLLRAQQEIARLKGSRASHPDRPSG